MGNLARGQIVMCLLTFICPAQLRHDFSVTTGDLDKETIDMLTLLGMAGPLDP